MKRYSLTVLVLFAIAFNTFGQAKRQSFLEMVGSLSLGVERHSVNYVSQSGQSIDLLYSGGGGVGAQFGAGVFLNKNFVLKLDLQYLLSIAAQIEIINGYRTESSASFSRVSLSPGLYYNYLLTNKGILRGIEAGGNIEYHIPGRLKIVENNTAYSPVSYSNDIGFKMRALGIVNLIEDRNLYLTIGLGFRGATHFSSNMVGSLDLNGSGVDFALGLRWFMGND